MQPAFKRYRGYLERAAWPIGAVTVPRRLIDLDDVLTAPPMTPPPGRRVSSRHRRLR
ncbi:MAG: hypothetical protein IPI57_07230 [Candidatus Competibacteraceae bacterium]|nr:hypothetical protein [Candidatus Competibacteraceae bacterium]